MSEQIMVTATGNIISTDRDLNGRSRGSRFPLSKEKADHYRKSGIVLFDEDVKAAKTADKKATQTDDNTKSIPPNTDPNASTASATTDSTAGTSTTGAKPQPKLTNEEKKKIAAEKKQKALEKQAKK